VGSYSSHSSILRLSLLTPLYSDSLLTTTTTTTTTTPRKWLRFSDKGGIGKALAIIDKLAESGTDELMFMDGDELVVLMQLGE